MDRLGYLGYYQEYWNCLLEPDDHMHEPGEDTSECYNCIMAELESKMSPFELACWNWYIENVNQFAMESGLVGEMFKDAKLKGKVRAMFLTALNAIHQTSNFIQAEILKQKRAGA